MTRRMFLPLMGSMLALAALSAAGDKVDIGPPAPDVPQPKLRRLTKAEKKQAKRERVRARKGAK